MVASGLASHVTLLLGSAGLARSPIIVIGTPLPRAGLEPRGVSVIVVPITVGVVEVLEERGRLLLTVPPSLVIILQRRNSTGAMRTIACSR